MWRFKGLWLEYNVVISTDSVLLLLFVVYTVRQMQNISSNTLNYENYVKSCQLYYILQALEYQKRVGRSHFFVVTTNLNFHVLFLHHSHFSFAVVYSFFMLYTGTKINGKIFG